MSPISGGRVVAGSNPVTPTLKSATYIKVGGWFIFSGTLLEHKGRITSILYTYTRKGDNTIDM